MRHSLKPQGTSTFYPLLALPILLFFTLSFLFTACASEVPSAKEEKPNAPAAEVVETEPEPPSSESAIRTIDKTEEEPKAPVAEEKNEPRAEEVIAPPQSPVADARSFEVPEPEVPSEGGEEIAEPPGVYGESSESAGSAEKSLDPEQRPEEEKPEEEKPVEESGDSVEEPAETAKPKGAAEGTAEGAATLQAAAEAAEAAARGAQEKAGHRSLRAQTGDTVDLFFPGVGWVYDQGSSSAAGIEFRERFYEDDRTEFVFRVVAPGSYQLRFFREEMSSGRQEQRVVDLISWGYADVEDPPSQDLNAPSEGRQEDPLGELTAALDRKDAGTILRYLSLAKSLAAGGDHKPEERAAEVEVRGEEAEDSNREETLAVEPRKALEIALEASDILERAGSEREALELLQVCLENGSGTEFQRERIYYLLGRLYEKPGPVRDEPTAVGYYRRLVDLFPAGIYWNEARERIRYLERHYLQLR